MSTRTHWRSRVVHGLASSALLFTSSAAAQTHVSTCIGDDFADYFGYSVSGLGDVNADGIADFVVGGYRGNGLHGRLKVYSGLDGTLIHHVLGSSGDGLVFTGRIGDVNADGFEDFYGNGLWGGGWLYSGANASILATTGGRFGGGVGDFDGDGHADYQVDLEVISGANGNMLQQLDTTNGWLARFVGDLNQDGKADYVTVNAAFGLTFFEARSITNNALLHQVVRSSNGETYAEGLGDVDADGIGDWGIFWTPFGQDPAVDVISGANGAVLRTLRGLTIGFQATEPLSGVGDADGDGYADFMVTTAPPRMFSGRTGGVLGQFVRDDGTNEAFSVSGIEDANGDGRPELVLGNPAAFGPNAEGTAALFSYDGALGTNYCTSTANSTGMAAEISASGSASVASNNLLLAVHSAPAQEPGLFVMGSAQLQVPFGNGFRCVGAGLLGTLRLPTQATDRNGHLLLQVDNTTAPAGPGLITPGSTWNFQGWFRDPAGGGAFFDLSDAVSVTFAP